MTEGEDTVCIWPSIVSTRPNHLLENVILVKEKRLPFPAIFSGCIECDLIFYFNDMIKY